MFENIFVKQLLQTICLTLLVIQAIFNGINQKLALAVISSIIFYATILIIIWSV